MGHSWLTLLAQRVGAPALPSPHTSSTYKMPQRLQAHSTSFLPAELPRPHPLGCCSGSPGRRRESRVLLEGTIFSPQASMEVAQAGGLITPRGGIHDAVVPGWARPLVLSGSSQLSPPCLCSLVHPTPWQFTACSPSSLAGPSEEHAAPSLPAWPRHPCPPSLTPGPQHGPGCHALLL